MKKFIKNRVILKLSRSLAHLGYYMNRQRQLYEIFKMLNEIGNVEKLKEIKKHLAIYVN